MTAKAQVVGSSLSGAYTSILLKDMGLQVEWHRTPVQNLPLRPLKIAEKHLRQIRRLCRYYGMGQRVYELSPKSPQVLSYSALMNLLQDLAKNCGVESKESAQFLNFKQDPADSLLVLAAEPEELTHWPKEDFHQSQGEYCLSYQTLYRAKVGTQAQRLLHQGSYCALEASLVVLEPVDEQNFVMSVIAKNRYSLERALQALHKANSCAPLAFKSLLMGAENIKELCLKRALSRDAFKVSQNFLPMGPSFGAFSMLSFGQDNFYFAQAERLRSLVWKSRQRMWDWEQLRRVWVNSEKRRLALDSLGAQVWERLLKRRQEPHSLHLKNRILSGLFRKFLKYPL